MCFASYHFRPLQVVHNVLRSPVLDVPVVEWLPAAAVTTLSVAVSSMSGRSLMSVPGHTL